MFLANQKITEKITLKISKKNLKRLLRVWKHENYEHRGSSNAMNGQYSVCKGCDNTQDYDDYKNFPHDEGCQVLVDEQYAESIEKKITRK